MAFAGEVRMHCGTLSLGLLVLGASSVASAADLTVQARLLAADGTPIQESTSLTVRLIDDAIANPPSSEVIHSETVSTPDVSDGYVSVRLADVPDERLAETLWVSFTSDGIELLPRQRVTTAPLAAVAGLVVTPATALQRYQGALRPPSGEALASCAAYLTDPAYRGEDWDQFWVDPDGAGAIVPMVVRCDMTTSGGGWAVWEAESGPWGWDRDGRLCYDLTLITEGQAWQMSRYTHTEHEVVTDTDFWFQEDDSVNTGSVYGRFLTNIDSAAAFDGSTPFRMDFTTTANNHVHIAWSPTGFDRVRATCASASSGCGTRNIPSNGADSAPLILTQIDANPICSGSSANANNWSRNGTAFQGSIYRVLLR